MAVAKVLTGAQKSAVLLLQLGMERSALVLRSLRESEVAEIMAEVARLRDVPEDMASAVIEEFKGLAETHGFVRSGGIEFARTLLHESLGEAKANEILERLSSQMIEMPFEFLRKADSRQVLSFLQDEHPGTIALVLAYMPPGGAAMVMSGLTEALQKEVALRLATMERTSPEVIEDIEAVLERKLSSVLAPTELTAAGGVQSLVDIINQADRATERLILEGLEQDDEELADEVRQRMFVFEDIGDLDDRSVQLILRQVDGKDLAVALKGVRADVRDKITRNMSQRAGQNLLEEIELLGPVRLSTVEESQGSIVRVIRALEESGQLVLTRAGGDEFVV
ncbi:MAG: Flagellar motor switch protein FliG [Actinomycetia bacterium]|nr:Flagellar motor switch protein FliG [Actinomycetes bacterium]